MTNTECVASSKGKSHDYHPENRQHKCIVSNKKNSIDTNEQLEGKSSSESHSMTSPAKVKPKEVILNTKQRKCQNKKIKQRAKKRAKDSYQKPFKAHLERLNLKGGTKDDPNVEELDKKLLENASYSMMHSLADGFSIILYSGTHKGLSKDVLHRNDAIQLILGPDMLVI